MADLQRLSALSWRPLETARLGGWRLRAGAGFTGRANSVLPLGDPGLPLDEAIAHVHASGTGSAASGRGSSCPSRSPQR